MARSKAPVTFVLAVLMVIASAFLILNSGPSPAEQAPSLTVVATLCAFVMALCFRQMGTLTSGGNSDRRLLIAALAIAAATLLMDARFVIQHRAANLRQVTPHIDR